MSSYIFTDLKSLGNIGSSTHDGDPVTLETPTLKGEVYTTGRGGSGNMAKNTDPEAARRAQDVVGYVLSTENQRFIHIEARTNIILSSAPRRESTSSAHVGRGGAANVFKPTEAEIAAAKRDNGKWDQAVADDEYTKLPEKGLADKGKDWLKGKIGKS
jgi:hypothetical protein